MSQSLGKFTLYLQDFIGKVKSYTVSQAADQIKEMAAKLEGSRNSEPNKQLKAMIEDTTVQVRRGGESLIQALDVFCEVLPEIIQAINQNEMENPTVSFLLKNLVLGAVNTVLALFESYYRAHYTLAGFEQDSGAIKERYLSVRVVDYVRLVQITMWFVPLKPVIEIQPKEFYSIVEPLFKSIESEQLYMTLQKKVQRMSLFWKSQAERDKMNKGRDVPR
jgi:hypothetical protein